MSALDGLLVVALEQAVAAPFCTSRLIQAGARVIKVERPEGDFARAYDAAVGGWSAYFVWLNGGKESIALDIKNPDDAQLLEAMIARADVFLQNLAPGAAARAGFGSEALRAKYPRLITCDITGYGGEGVWAGMKAYDFLVQCEAGLASMTGLGPEASRVGVSVADIACGMNAHAAILQALYQRGRTGRGSGIAVSLFASLAEWMAVPLLQFEHTGEPPPRLGMHHPTIAPYGAYRVGDGLELVVAVQNQREWERFCAAVLDRGELVADPRFETNPARCAHRRELDDLIHEVFRRLTREELVERLSRAGIAFGRINGLAELATHPALRRTPILAGERTVEAPGPAFDQACEDRPSPRVCPVLDAHGVALRREFS